MLAHRLWWIDQPTVVPRALAIAEANFVLRAVVDHARGAPAFALPQCPGVYECTHHQRILHEHDITVVRLVNSIHESIVHVHANFQNGATGGILAVAGIVPVANLDGVRLVGLGVQKRRHPKKRAGGEVRVRIVGVDPTVSRAHAALAHLSAQVPGQPPTGEQALKKPPQLRRVDNHEDIYRSSGKEDRNIPLADLHVVQRVVQQSDRHTVEEDVSAEGELPQLQRHVVIWRCEKSRPDDHEHIEDFAANDCTNTNVGRLPNRNQVQGHLGSVAPQCHQRRPSNVFRDLEPLGDHINRAHEVYVTHVRHAPKQVDDDWPPKPSEHFDVHMHRPRRQRQRRWYRTGLLRSKGAQKQNQHSREGEHDA
mmetsp:Transcript_66463/g.155856  ORF Transcript_66463/g.155856 Transcript_66463/m.155856 type:complete len:366 (-) Transcript_66463:72-1169(-)